MAIIFVASAKDSMLESSDLSRVKKIIVGVIFFLLSSCKLRTQFHAHSLLLLENNIQHNCGPLGSLTFLIVQLYFGAY